MTTNQDQTIYVTENKQEFVPEVGCTYGFFKNPELYWDNSGVMSEWEDGDELEVVALKGNELEVQIPIVWNKRDLTGSSINPALLKPLKTEAEIRREAEIKALQSASAHKKNHKSNEYVMIPIDEHQAENILDHGYIKPREITPEQISDIILSKVGPVEAVMFSQKASELLAYAISKHIKGEA